MKPTPDIYNRAVAAYARLCARTGALYVQPSAGASDVSTDAVVLRNGKGDLASYRITATGRLALAK
jgi:hypothetical protein